MRISVNLATQPYEDVRAFLTKWGVGLFLLIVATAILVSAAVSGWRHSRDIARDIHIKQDEIAKLKQDEKRAEAVLNEPQNLGTREQSALLNQLFARKAFSWTQVFTDLEKLMPTSVRLSSIQPQLDKSGQLEISINVIGNSREKAIELLRNLEDSPHFQNPELRSETNDPQTNGTVFQISALYVPQIAADNAKPAAETVKPAVEKAHPKSPGGAR